MHVYGSKRRDALTCRYGCCAGKYNKHRNYRKVCDRARRHRARQQARKEILASLCTNT